MTLNIPSNALLEWCHTIPLDELQTSAINAIRWESGLAERIAALDPDMIDTPDAHGITALGRLASTRPPGEELRFVLARGVEMLLAAGANPLSGTRPAILRGQVFGEDPRVNRMLFALVDAQRAGTPYRMPGSGGNLLHAMVKIDISMFAHLAQDNLGALRGARDVVGAWRDEMDVQGKTPVELAWEEYPTPQGGRRRS